MIHLRDPARAHRLFIAAALVAALWGVRTGVLGFPLHFLGAAALYLLFGARLALVGIALTAALVAALGGLDWPSLPAAWLADGAVPVAVAALFYRAVLRWLPPNPFVYFFGAAFAGAALSMLASLVAHLALGERIEPFVAIALMLGFGEAFLTGGLLTLLVVYHGEWVSTFDDAYWLRRR